MNTLNGLWLDEHDLNYAKSILSFLLQAISELFKTFTFESTFAEDFCLLTFFIKKSENETKYLPYARGHNNKTRGFSIMNEFSLRTPAYMDYLSP